MDSVSGVCCKSVLSLLNLVVIEPCFHDNTIVIQVLFHREETIQTAFLQFVNFVEIFDAAFLRID